MSPNPLVIFVWEGGWRSAHTLPVPSPQPSVSQVKVIDFPSGTTVCSLKPDARLGMVMCTKLWQVRPHPSWGPSRWARACQAVSALPPHLHAFVLLSSAGGELPDPNRMRGGDVACDLRSDLSATAL